MKILTKVIAGVLIALVIFLTLSGMTYWVMRMTRSDHKLYVHHGIKACHCGYNNVVDSVSIKNGNMIFYFDGKTGIYQHYNTWIDTVAITTFTR